MMSRILSFMTCISILMICTVVVCYKPLISYEGGSFTGIDFQWYGSGAFLMSFFNGMQENEDLVRI